MSDSERRSSVALISTLYSVQRIIHDADEKKILGNKLLQLGNCM